ncbi:MAG TPA: orotidine 5'-phosphate decarboxylase, partial [bacterium]|nr:orotidine 5'-phosphate decarboxylase [bacterium]
MKPVIQVALDFIDLARALQVAREAVQGGADWLEAGTPLIKSVGLDSVRKLRELFPGKTIVADLKTFDAGRLEVEMAAKAGAGIVCVLGNAPDATLKECVLAGRNYGARIMADLLGVESVEARAVELVGFGIDYLNVHLGIDEQMQGRQSFDLIRRLARRVEAPLAAAGGLNTETAVQALKAGASIFIVGGAITKSPDAAAATRLFKKALKEKRPGNTELYRRVGPEGLLEV